MRRFRGKRLGNGEWVYGDLLSSGVVGQDVIVEKVMSDDASYFSIECRNVLPETVGQFINVDDDEPENELYEGDIIKMTYEGKEIVGSIQYEGGGYILVSDDFEDGYMPVSELTNNDRRYFWIPTAELIGNIHDNPELVDK